MCRLDVSGFGWIWDGSWWVLMDCVWMSVGFGGFWLDVGRCLLISVFHFQVLALRAEFVILHAPFWIWDLPFTCCDFFFHIYIVYMFDVAF